tara:strand:+ start:41 stop:574 length:534 start_codon:yes stop_codon:yes gene_type:complete
MRKEITEQLEKITENYSNLTDLQVQINEVIKLNVEDWGNNNHNNRFRIQQHIDDIHWKLTFGMLENIGRIRVFKREKNHPQGTLLLNPYLMCEISNDGEHYNFILFPMKNNSSESYPPINYYQQPISEGKLNEEKFEMIVKEMGVGVTQRDCGYDMMKLERFGIIESKTNELETIKN